MDTSQVSQQESMSQVEPAEPTPVPEEVSRVESPPEPAAEISPASAAFLPQAAPAAPTEITVVQKGSQVASLLTSLIRGLDTGEEAVDIDAALATVPGLAGGPSEGGFSWHTLEPCMRCWRLAYYLYALGVKPKRKSTALAFGSLYHACWEVWYKSGGQRRYDEPCDAVRRAGAPKLAGEVQRLVYTELMKYAQEEADTWDIRAVEHNAVFWAEPERINGKLVQLPFSCRHDMLIALRTPGSPCSPPGPVEGGIHIVDRKTAGALTYDLTKGYAMDGQFLMNAVVFRRSTEEREFGPFRGMIFSVAVKHKEPAVDKSYLRVHTTVEDDALEAFYQTELRPFASELYRRLSTPEIRGDMSRWATNRAACVGRYGICPYFDLCDYGGMSVIDAFYDVDPKHAFNLEKLAPPPADVRRASRTNDMAKQAAEEARRKKLDEKKRVGAMLIVDLRASLLALPNFDRQLFLVPNHTPKTVKDQLFQVLRELWPQGTKFPFRDSSDESREFTIEVAEKGFVWDLRTKATETAASSLIAKGTIVYKTMADWICQDWWDISKLQPPTQ